MSEKIWLGPVCVGVAEEAFVEERALDKNVYKGVKRVPKEQQTVPGIGSAGEPFAEEVCSWKEGKASNKTEDR